MRGVGDDASVPAKGIFPRFVVYGLAICLAAVNAPAATAGSSNSQLLRHSAPEHYLKTEPLVLKAETQGRLDWLMVFWKSPEAEDYESVALETEDGRVYQGRLETSSLRGGSLDYYLAFKLDGRILYFPENAPDSVVTVKDATPDVTVPPSPPQESTAARPARRFPIRLDGSAENIVYGEEEPLQGSRFVQNHQLRVEFGYRREGLSLEFGARLAYTNQPIAGEDAFDLPSLNLSAAVRNHSFKLGDLAISESEFTIASFGRRGIEYGFAGQTFSLRLFTSATQQMRGFKGFGWPRTGASLVGGAASFTLWRTITLKAVFIMGEDDPALGTNVGTSPQFHRRKGQVLSFIGETRLFNDSLGVQAEFAAGRYDADLEDGDDPVLGTAYRVQGDFRKGVFDLRAAYRSIDGNFNTVGQPFLQNDRRGFEAASGLSLGRVRLSGTFRAEETNVDEDPDLATARLRQARVDLNLGLGGTSSIRLGWLTEGQDALFSTGVWNPYPAFEGQLQKTGLTGGVDVGIAPWLRLSFSGERSELRCPQTPAMEGVQTSAMAGLQVAIPDRLTFFPVLTYSRIRQTAAGAENRTLMASFNGEFTIIRRWVSWNFSGAYGDTHLEAAGPTKTMAADTGLNLNLEPLIRMGEVLISLRAQYIRTEMTGQTTETRRAVVRLSYSF